MKRICATCKFFKPATSVFVGTCRNMRAALGAVLQTSPGSTCNYHEDCDTEKEKE